VLRDALSGGRGGGGGATSCPPSCGPWGRVAGSDDGGGGGQRPSDRPPPPRLPRQVGKHSPAHARAVARIDALPGTCCAPLHTSDASSADLIDKSKRCLKGAALQQRPRTRARTAHFRPPRDAILSQCDYIPAMQSLLPGAPPP